MSNTVIVKTGEMKTIDFKVDEAAMTMDLGTCVAVAARDNGKGCLAHLTLRTDLNSFFQWFNDSASKNAQLYLVGGWEPNSNGYISVLKQGLSFMGYSITAEDILARQGALRKITLKAEGPIVVQQYRLVKTPEEDVYVTVGLKNLL